MLTFNFADAGTFSLRALLDSAAQVIRILNVTAGINVLSTQWYIMFYAVSSEYDLCSDSGSSLIFR